MTDVSRPWHLAALVLGAVVVVVSTALLVMGYFGGDNLVAHPLAVGVASAYQISMAAILMCVLAGATRSEIRTRRQLRALSAGPLVLVVEPILV